MRYRYLVFLFLQLSFTYLWGQGAGSFVSTHNEANNFILTNQGITIPFLIDTTDFVGINRAAANLFSDFKKVTGESVRSHSHFPDETKSFVIIGTLGKNVYVDQLMQKGLIDQAQLQGKHEKLIIQTILNSFPGIDEALVIAGSDKRGTIYGIYELSKQIGVSIWYYWADVPVRESQNFYVTRGTYTVGEPAVEYRGIFVNDEASALTDWCNFNFGDFNHTLIQLANCL